MTVVALLSWFVFVRVDEPDWGAFAAVFEGSLVVGNAILFSISFLDPRIREIRSSRVGFGLALLPIALCFVVFSATSFGVSADDWSSGTPVVGAIAQLCFLGIAAMLCGLLVYLMLVLPALWLTRAIRPTKKLEGGVYLGMSRGELVGASLVFPSIIVFAIAMVNMVADPDGSTRAQRRAEQLIAFITFQGEVAPTIIAWLSIAAIVACLVGYGRAYRARIAAQRDAAEEN
jgi:hypothetical protein